MVQINEPAIDFSLPDLEGKDHHLSDYRGQTVVLNFWSCECPHSERADLALMAMKNQWAREAVFVAIASNRNESRESIQKVSTEHKLPLLLTDAHHLVADLYEAVTTPHLFLIDPSGILRYRGALDDVTFRRREATRCYLEAALRAVLAGEVPALGESPAYGCAIVREV